MTEKRMRSTTGVITSKIPGSQAPRKYYTATAIDIYGRKNLRF
jgi:hypothetical protein